MLLITAIMIFVGVCALMAYEYMGLGQGLNEGVEDDEESR